MVLLFLLLLLSYMFHGSSLTSRLGLPKKAKRERKAPPSRSSSIDTTTSKAEARCCAVLDSMYTKVPYQASFFYSPEQKSDRAQQCTGDNPASPLKAFPKSLYTSFTYFIYHLTGGSVMIVYATMTVKATPRKSQMFVYNVPCPISSL